MKKLLTVALAALLASCGGSSSSSPSVQGNSADTSDDTSNTGTSGELSFGEPTLSQIRPGVEVVADGASCTSNFLFYLNDQTVYLGAAAHCFSPDANAGLDPCETANLAIGSPVSIENASQPGSLAYTSWRAMQEVGENPGTASCVYNDFALVRLHPDDIANIHPAVRAYGGPTAMFTGVAGVGDEVHAYGHSIFHLGIEALETRSGEVVAVLEDDWVYDVSNDLPGLGVPGDSGGPVMDANGRALAVTSVLTFSLSQNPVSNGVVNLNKALNYAKEHGFINAGVSLMTWSEFSVSGGL